MAVAMASPSHSSCPTISRKIAETINIKMAYPIATFVRLDILVPPLLINIEKIDITCKIIPH